MRTKLLIVLSILVTAMVACNRVQKLSLLLPGTLSSSFYTINTSTDTVLTTDKGAAIKIPKGSLKTSSGQARIEVKEAYTIQDMVRAGLTTRSNGKPLASGGMIYINAAEGETVEITGPISVAIPTSHYQEEMQLYKGEPSADGTINWTKPVPIEPNESTAQLDRGKQLFASCTSCHHLTEDATGPPLVHITKRRDYEWIERFTRNPAKLISRGDRLANCVYNKWGKTSMTPFPNLSNEDMHDLYAYIENESKAYPLPPGPDDKACVDSCEAYERKKEQLTRQRNTLIEQNGARIEVDYARGGTGSTTTTPPGGGPVAKEVDLVATWERPSVYYQFSIDAFGWHNVDDLIEGKPGFKDSELTVRLGSSNTDDVQVFLVLPDDKVFLEAGPLNDGSGAMGFFSTDGHIPLPQGRPGYLLALGEKDGEILFAMQSFTTSPKGSYSISPAATTKAAFEQAISGITATDFDILLKDSKNATEIRATDDSLSTVEGLRPKNCDCDCGTNMDEASIITYTTLPAK